VGRKIALRAHFGFHIDQLEDCKDNKERRKLLEATSGMAGVDKGLRDDFARHDGCVVEIKKTNSQKPAKIEPSRNHIT
jgi:hypothetical protein